MLTIILHDVDDSHFHHGANRAFQSELRSDGLHLAEFSNYVTLLLCFYRDHACIKDS